MLQIRLDAEYPVKDSDPLGRTCLGYRPGMTEREAWDAGRGVWSLDSERALRNIEAQIIDRGGIVRAVARITGITKHDTTRHRRRALEGEVLLGDPRVGRPTRWPHPSQNPVAYVGKDA